MIVTDSRMSRGPRASPSRSGSGGFLPGADRTSRSCWWGEHRCQAMGWTRAGPQAPTSRGQAIRDTSTVRAICAFPNSRNRGPGATKPPHGMVHPAAVCCSAAVAGLTGFVLAQRPETRTIAAISFSIAYRYPQPCTSCGSQLLF